jgi:hypothetical protein
MGGRFACRGTVFPFLPPDASFKKGKKTMKDCNDGIAGKKRERMEARKG